MREVQEIVASVVDLIARGEVKGSVGTITGGVVERGQEGVGGLAVARVGAVVLGPGSSVHERNNRFMAREGNRVE